MPDPSDSRAIAPPNSSTISLEIVHAAGSWGALGDVDGLIEAAAHALAAHPRLRDRPACEACVALSDDATVRELNATFRAKDKPTNVLSFPAPELSSAPPGSLRQLGDIVLAAETVQREADEQGVSCAHHLQHLVVHGVLHLLGFDHEVDSDAEEMEMLEIEVLAQLGIADPYSSGTGDMRTVEAEG